MDHHGLIHIVSILHWLYGQLKLFSQNSVVLLTKYMSKSYHLKSEGSLNRLDAFEINEK